MGETICAPYSRAAVAAEPSTSVARNRGNSAAGVHLADTIVESIRNVEVAC